MRAAAGGGIAAGVLAAIAVHQMRARAHEKRARSELDRLVALLPHCGNEDQALSAAERAFTSAFACPLAILSNSGEVGEVSVRRQTPGCPASPDDLAAAREAMNGARVIRRRTSGGSYSHFVPLLTWRGAVGALAFAPQRDLSRRLLRIVQAFADQVALTLLRSVLAREARDATWFSEADRFQKALLNSIAHNVRTPLASIIGVLSSLQEDHAALNPDIRRDLVETARQEADRLNRLLGNLLDLSRIEAGAVQVRADPCDVQDLIGAAIEQLGGRGRDRQIEVRIDPNLPLIRMDFVLIVQVLVNLLDNAVKYSGAETPIQVSAAASNGVLELRVEDSGDGVAESDLSTIFDKFNRAGRTGETGGIGLGLSICKGLVEAHCGSIWAERRFPRGTTVVFRLPANSEVNHDGEYARSGGRR